MNKYQKKFHQLHPDYGKKYMQYKKQGKRYSIKTVWLTHDPTYKQRYYKKNYKKIKIRQKKWMKENYQRVVKSKQKYYKKCPYARTLSNIRQRCNNKNEPKYKYYGGKGIKSFITINELKSLWIRDNAISMRQPSIDRINNNGNYTLDNCRFIEMEQNRLNRKY